jgi:hypothetical protein
MKFSIEIVTHGVEYPRFRRIYHSEDFNREVATAANITRTLLEHKVLPDGKESRRIRVVPNVTLPAALKSVLKDGSLSYEELTVFDPQTRSATYAIESQLGEKLQVVGNAHFHEEQGGVRLHFEGEANVKMFGVGGLVERYVVGEVRERYATVERLLQKFIDEGRSLTPPAPAGP